MYSAYSAAEKGSVLTLFSRFEVFPWAGVHFQGTGIRVFILMYHDGEGRYMIWTAGTCVGRPSDYHTYPHVCPEDPAFLPSMNISIAALPWWKKIRRVSASSVSSLIRAKNPRKVKMRNRQSAVTVKAGPMYLVPVLCMY